MSHPDRPVHMTPQQVRRMQAFMRLKVASQRLLDALKDPDEEEHEPQPKAEARVG